jgi:hypothetical protein
MGAGWNSMRSATVMMSVQTNATVSRGPAGQRYRGLVFACFVLPWLLRGRRRRGLHRSVAMCTVLALLVGAVGCGARSISAGALGGQSYTLTVTGTSTNLAGAVVSHSTQVTLVVESRASAHPKVVSFWGTRAAGGQLLHCDCASIVMRQRVHVFRRGRVCGNFYPV